MDTLKNVQKFFQGKKAYILGLVAVVWAIVGWSFGFIEAQYAQEIAWGGLTAIALRAGMKK